MHDSRRMVRLGKVKGPEIELSPRGRGGLSISGDMVSLSTCQLNSRTFLLSNQSSVALDSDRADCVASTREEPDTYEQRRN